MTTTPHNLPEGLDPEVVALQTLLELRVMFDDTVEVRLDREGDLGITIITSNNTLETAWLKLPEMIALRDHLTKLIAGRDRACDCQGCKNDDGCYQEDEDSSLKSGSLENLHHL
jgi:hypothetical protein